MSSILLKHVKHFNESILIKIQESGLKQVLNRILVNSYFQTKICLKKEGKILLDKK